MRRSHLVLASVLFVGCAGPAADTQTGEVPAGWLARAQEHIAEREYWASPAGDGLQAPNRAQNLRTWFEPTGVRVHDRTAADSELVSLRLAATGREGALAAVEPGVVTNDGNRVEIRRAGLTEWYVNSAAGLEQGFTLAERPAGEGPLVLELAVDHARASLRGDAVVLATEAGRKLNYGKLVVLDAENRTVVARLEVPEAERIRLVVDDAGAAYPLVIDPLLTEAPDTQLESDQDFARMGWSVAGAGDVNGDGYADVIVGAPLYDAGQTDEGAAFVFLGSAAGIADADATAAAAQLESNEAGAEMGFSVAGAGDVNGDGYADVVVGAWQCNNGDGAAFVFLGSAAGIADGSPATAAAQLESDQANTLMGQSVAGAGDVNADGYADVIVGALWYDNPTSDEGAAFVFLGSASGIADGSPATAAAQLETNQASAQMGVSVAGAGDVNGDGYADVIVGALAYDAGQTDEGAAFVFLGGAAGIADGSPTTASAQLESDQVNTDLGVSVAGAGDVNGDGYADVIVGARDYDAGETDEGAAFVFLGSATGIADGNPDSAAAMLQSNQHSADMGHSVAGAGDVDGDGYADVIVGARFHDHANGETDEGAAFVFLGGAAGIADGEPFTSAAHLESNQASASMGYSVAGAGDVNGDGYADVIVGAHRYDAGHTDEGAAFVFLGSATGVADGTPTTAAAQLESNQTSAVMGISVAGAGDVNGDGYADVIVGAHTYDAGHTNEGAAFVFLGSATGIADGTPTTAATQLESDQDFAQMGSSVGGAGDVNGDGYADVIVGAPGYGDLEEGESAAFVFLGSAAGIADGSPATAAAHLEGEGMGYSVAGAGDVNGDGYADVIVSAEEAAFVFLGSAAGIADGTSATAAAQLESNQAGADMDRVAAAGDVNGDGYADVIVGAPFYNAGQSYEGAAFVFLGSAAGIADGDPTTAAAQLESNQAGADFGWSVAGAGDVNGDGYADVIVGALAYDAGLSDEGAAFVFLGSATGIADGSPTTAAAQLESNQDSAFMGESVAGAGDVNGDGFADVIVGAADYGWGNVDEGAAFVFLGNSAGRPTLARQRRGDGSGIPVQPWGASEDVDAFAVELRASHPQGAGRVRAEFEACAAGTPFGDAACTTATTAWTLLSGGTEDVLLTADLTGLTEGTLYHWRARVQHAEPTGALPAEPAHGPWRRVSAQAGEADIRTASLPACSNGLDDDGDAEIDYPDDPGCAGAADASEDQEGLVCDDGLDNDGDGNADFPDDSGCRLVTSGNESPQCQDGLNNDNQAGIDHDGGLSLDLAPLDGLIDAAFNPATPPVGAPDPQCNAAWKNKEKASACGLGFELALLLPLLEARRRRARR